MRIQPIFSGKDVRTTLSNEFRTGQPESKEILILCLPFECSKLQMHPEGRFSVSWDQCRLACPGYARPLLFLW